MKVINIGKLRESNEQSQLVMGKDNSTRMLKATYHQQTANNSIIWFKTDELWINEILNVIHC